MRIAICLALILAACGAPPALQRSQQLPYLTPATPATRLLYVSDLYNSAVDVYTVPALKFVRRIGGFLEPEGACTDAHGDVWIADTGNLRMLKFEPGGTTPVASLTDALGFPAGCAVNVNGDLAVANEYGVSGAGQVLIYRHASGTPAAYRNNVQYSYNFAGYDNKGDLYASGSTLKGTYALSSLAVGAKSMAAVSISGGTIYLAGSVFWRDAKLVLGDQECRGGTASCLYETTISGQNARIAVTIPLTGSCDVAQVVLLGDALYGGNYNYCSKAASSTDRWSYPQGAKQVGVSGVRQPVGAAISGPATERL